jgi:hypothetical protein
MFMTLDAHPDPVISALLAADGDAVEPLIAVVDHDERMSHVEFDHPASSPSQPAPVYRVACWILERVLDTDYLATSHAGHFMYVDPSQRARVAEKLRAEWARTGKRSRAERAFETLADDHADPEVWLDAARKMFLWMPEPSQDRSHGVSWHSPVPRAVLRAKSHPSVTDLVRRRVEQVPRDEACELVALLSGFDPQAALALAAPQMQAAIAASGASDRETKSIVLLTTVREKLGDERALDEYAAWVGQLEPARVTEWQLDLLLPMTSQPMRPSMLRAADQLFGPGSKWLPFVPDTPGPSAADRVRLLETNARMFAVPAFRRYVLEQLEDRRVLGQLWTRADGTYEYNLVNGIHRSTAARLDDDGFPPKPVHAPLRACDYYAHYVSVQPDAPTFALYWDLARRDRAIGELEAWLRTR